MSYRVLIILSVMAVCGAATVPAVAAQSTQTQTQPPAAAPATDRVIHVGVNGMVCDFCAQTLKKTFGKQPGVKQVAISLEDKLITLHIAHDAALDDAKIRQLVTDAGYAITTIHRI